MARLWAVAWGPAPSLHTPDVVGALHLVEPVIEVDLPAAEKIVVVLQPGDAPFVQRDREEEHGEDDDVGDGHIGMLVRCEFGWIEELEVNVDGQRLVLFTANVGTDSGAPDEYEAVLVAPLSVRDTVRFDRVVLEDGVDQILDKAIDLYE